MLSIRPPQEIDELIKALFFVIELELRLFEVVDKILPSYSAIAFHEVVEIASETFDGIVSTFKFCDTVENKKAGELFPVLFVQSVIEQSILVAFE